VAVTDGVRDGARLALIACFRAALKSPFMLASRSYKSRISRPGATAISWATFCLVGKSGMLIRAKVSLVLGSRWGIGMDGLATGCMRGRALEVVELREFDGRLYALSSGFMVGFTN
jgi:hypothetical protein